MNQSSALTQLPILELTILFSAFCILLALLIIGNPAPVNQITIENIDDIHEIFQIDTQQIEEPITKLLLNKGSNILIGTTGKMDYVWNFPNSTQQINSMADTSGVVDSIRFLDNKPVAIFEIGRIR